jgi:hypothetical protein
MISGAQTGADRAALDAATMLKFLHGGWIPKGCLAEDGPLPSKYSVEEMPTKNYPARTERNVIDSNRTVIITHGKLNGGSKRTAEFAKKRNRSCLRVDLNKALGHLATTAIRIWIAENQIQVLNVAGSRASKDPEIYDEVFRIVAGVIQAEKRAEKFDEPSTGEYLEIHFTGADLNLPRSVHEAIDGIISDMTLEERVRLANLDEDQLLPLELVTERYLTEKLRQRQVNDDVPNSSRDYFRDRTANAPQMARLLTREIWRRLQKTHRMRVVGSGTD